MNKVLLALLSCVLSVISFTGIAAEPRQEPTEQERARTVYIFHQPIYYGRQAAIILLCNPVQCRNGQMAYSKRQGSNC